MNEQEVTRKKSRRDLLLILLILPFGVLCTFLTGQTAISLSPEWQLDVAMKSLLDPNATFVAQGIPALIEPVNPGILTQPAWRDSFLTPSASIPTRTFLSPTPSPISTEPPPIPTSIPQEKPTTTATVPGPIIIPTRNGPGQADLRIQKSDNSSTYTPGTSINYTILVTNLGPDAVPKFNIIDDVPVVITGLSVSCSPASRCGTNTSSGNRVSFSDAALLNGEVITISISGTMASSATGPLVNTASVTIPSGVRVNDPNAANNTVTDRDTQRSVYDVAITKSDGSDTYTATSPINYNITVTNSGPSDALGITVRDEKPSQITTWGWCVVPCTPNPYASNTNLSRTVDIPSGGTIQLSVSAIPTGAPEDILNRARLIIPSGPGTIVEQNLLNNTAVDIDIPYIDLQITKDDGTIAYVPGGTVNYTVTVTNKSTFNLTGITVTDNIPALIDPLTWAWTCAPAPGSTGASCTDSGNTGINDTAVNLPANEAVVYSISATALLSPTGDLINTATVSPPAGLVDAVPADNTATDINTPSIGVDLSITKDNSVTTYTPGGSINYTVTVTNNSTVALTGVTVIDNIPALIEPGTWTWTCAPAPGPPGASCTGSGNTGINDTAVNLPANGSVVYSITATVRGAAIGELRNTATVNAPAGFVDTDLSNNTATHIDANADGEPEIGPPDGNVYPIPWGGSATFYLSQPIIANGDAGPDFVFHEQRYTDPTLGIGIELDQVVVEVSPDGNVWYQVFFWGDLVPDTNTNIASVPNITVDCPNEDDNCFISEVYLYPYPGWGIAIDVDTLPQGPQIPYMTELYWIRFTEPGITAGDGTHVDAIEILP